jgi:branched-chain amino acid transport system ATP-binding protein
VPVLRNVSLDLSDGVVAILGLNGSGKSTLMRTAAGLTRLTQGTISLDGDDLSGLPAHDVVRRGISFMPQSNQLFASLSVAENLWLGGYVLSRAERKVELERVLQSIPLLAKKLRLRAGHLSGGERQLLALGRVLMQRPKVLLLDEPTGGLSPKASVGIYELLGTLKAKGLPMLLADQNVRGALGIADSVIVLYLGSIQACLEAATVRSSPDRLRDLMMGLRRKA